MADEYTGERAARDAPPLSQAPTSLGSARSQELSTAGRNAIKLAISLTITWTVALLIRFPVPILLGPERYGALNFSENYAAAFFAVLDLGVSTYIFREIPVRPSHASDFWGGLLVARLGISALLFAGMALGLLRSHHSLEVQAAVAVFGLAQFVTTYNVSIAALLQAVSRVNRVAIANVASKIVWGAGLLGALLFSHSLPLLAAPLLASEALKLLVLYPEAKDALKLRLRVDYRETKVALIACLPFLISGGAVNIGGRLNVTALEFVIGDKREVGWFGAAQNLAGLTMFLSPLFSWVLLPLLSRARARSEEEVYQILRRTIEGLLVILVPVTLITSLGAEHWMRLLFRAAYDEGALSLRVLAFGFILIYLAIALSTLLIMTGHSWSVSVISLASVPFRPLLVYLLAAPCVRHFGAGGGALGAALAEVLTSVGIVAAHFIPIGGRALDRRLLLVGGKSLLAAAAVIAVDRTVLRHHGWGRIAADAALYVALALAIGAVRVNEVIRLVKTLRADRRQAKQAAAAPPPSAA
ncbi:MAG: oligosaccharide flippase family protein [Myxococcales bacterium]|nr:oligosaccharide flippase family protein [Myxococcales bacterium]